MDYKKTNAPSNTITRNMVELCEDTGNVYETVAIIGKRANQIAVCLLYTSPSPRDAHESRMPSSA